MMKHSLFLSSSYAFSITAASAYTSGELWSRAASQSIKVKDLEDYGDFVILPRAPATTRAQTRAQNEAARGGGNQNLGVARGGVGAGRAEGRGRAGRAGRGRGRGQEGNTGRGRDRDRAGDAGCAGVVAGAANLGRGAFQDPGSYQHYYPSDAGFPMNPIVGGPNSQALQPITAVASQARAIAARGALQNVRGMAERPHIPRPTGDQWITHGAQHDTVMVFPHDQLYAAMGTSDVSNGEGYFHTALGSHRGAEIANWRASERQTPIPHTARGTLAQAYAWNTHAVKTGLTITQANIPQAADPQAWSGGVVTAGNDRVRTMLSLPRGTTAHMRIAQGHGMRSFQDY